jgi:hypothetical protein
MAKGPIEFLEDLTEKKVSWEDQSDLDMRNYSPFMMNRWLSMSADWLEIIAETQRYTAVISPRINYLFYRDLLPKKKIYFKYTKAQSEKTQKYDEISELISERLNISRKDAYDYILILLNSGRSADLEEIVGYYGFSENEVSKMIK